MPHARACMVVFPSTVPWRDPLPHARTRVECASMFGSARMRDCAPAPCLFARARTRDFWNCEKHTLDSVIWLEM